MSKVSKTTVSLGKIRITFVNSFFNGHLIRKVLEELMNTSHSSVFLNVRMRFNLFLLQDQYSVAKWYADFIEFL